MSIDELELGKARAAVALGVAELTRRTSYPKNRWSEVFTGKTWPKQKSLEAAAKALGVEADYLAIAILERRIEKRARKKVDAQRKQE